MVETVCLGYWNWSQVPDPDRVTGRSVSDDVRSTNFNWSTIFGSSGVRIKFLDRFYCAWSVINWLRGKWGKESKTEREKEREREREREKREREREWERERAN